MSDVSLAFNVVGRDRGVNALLTRTANNVRSSSISGAAGTMALRAAWAVAAAEAIALANSAMVAAGAVAAVPAAMAGGAAILGAAKAVTFGLGDAWKATGQAATGGGGSVNNAAQQAVQAAREVRDATQALVDAKRNEVDATKAVNDARAQEAIRLRDLSVSLAGSKLDEESATLAVAKAAQDLAVAKAGGSNEAIQEATLAYEQAQQTLVETKNRTTDLTAQQADGAKKGVEGSDAVQSALRQQQDAQEQVTKAAEQLADAQQRVQSASAGAASGGINPATAALAKLSPAGRSVILMLRELAPAWEGAARAGQQTTFTGVTGDLKRLSGDYLPMATSWLGRMGGAFNTAIRQSLGLLQTKAVIKDVGTFTGNVAAATGKLATAIRPVINGIIQWVTVGSNFLPEFAGWAVKGADAFEKWSVHMRDSGTASKWISNGIAVLKQLYAIALNVGYSLLAIVHAGGDGGQLVGFLVTVTGKMREFLTSSKGQHDISTVLGTLRGVLTGLVPVLGEVAGHAGDFSGTLSVTGTIVRFAAGHLGTLAKLLPVIAAGFAIAKLAEIGANAASVIRVPILIAQTVAQFRLGSIMKANTAAIKGNSVASESNAAATEESTVAENTGILARGRAVVAMVAQKVATVAGTVVTWAATAATTAFGVAMDIATGPIGIVILLIAGLVAGFVLLWNKSAAFRNFWIGLWVAIKGGAEIVGLWFKNTLWGSWIKGAWDGMISKGNSAVNWFKALPGKLKTAMTNIGAILLSPFKWAFNQIASFWDRGPGRLSFTVPSWIPLAGGKSFSMPQIPQLAQGGIVRARAGGQLVNAGEAGRDEAIIPLPRGTQSLGGPQEVTVRIVVEGGDRQMRKMIRGWIRTDALLSNAIGNTG